ncbi:MAG TPA: metal-dependent hydrolase [Bryobacteraceae bacterium]|nr:metal-dependent hydrolase [Bryobacteraceae bacterium]
MLVGHFAVAFAAKRIDATLSLGTAVLAAMLADVLAFSFVAAGVERFRVVPEFQTNRLVGENIVFSHSLVMDVFWGALFACAYFLWRRRSRAARILFAAVVSHWVLDAISHRPDMRFGPGIPGAVGLGLWNSIPATLAVEGGFWLLAVILYVRATRAAKRPGIYAFWIGVALLSLAWFGNVSAPPPAGSKNNAIAAALPSLIFFALAIAWAYWMNTARTSETPPAQEFVAAV